MPDVTRCRLTLPTEPELDGIKIERGNRDADLLFVPLFAGRTYKLIVSGVDKCAAPFSRLLSPSLAFSTLLSPSLNLSLRHVIRCGNELDRGGSAVTARITSIGGVAPPKNGDNNFPCEDNEDGTYSVRLTPNQTPLSSSRLLSSSHTFSRLFETPSLDFSRLLSPSLSPSPSSSGDALVQGARRSEGRCHHRQASEEEEQDSTHDFT